MNACITLPIAIIGVGLRLPGGVNDLDSLWSVLQGGRDCIVPIPSERFNAARFYHPERTHPGTSVCMQAGLLDDIYAFDAEFFGISPKEAAAMDPQQRLLLQLTWEAFEDAGLVPSSYANSDTAVFVGAASPDSGTIHADDLCATSPYSMTGTNLSIIANRISYIYNFHGPSYTLDTACSSAMYALYAACQALAHGETSLAIAAGVNVLLAPYAFVGFSQAYMLSPEGRCKVFDATGDGYVRSEGGGVLLLEPLQEAVDKGHPIHAVIRGIGCNSDGRTQGIALPSQEAQAALLKMVYTESHCDPNTLSYLEAHGTGTIVGDPIEARAIGEVLGQKRERPLTIGSVKCNLGHLETASAMAGIMKALAMLRTRQIPRQINLSKLNPAIDFHALNLSVPLELTNLPKGTDSTYRIGVNSFGFGGANGHVLLESVEEPASPALSDVTSLPPLCLQARSSKSLEDFAKSIYNLVHADPKAYVAIASRLAHKYEAMPNRVVIEEKDQTHLNDLADPNVNLKQAQAQIPLTPRPKCAFVFTGNGCHWVGMAKDLLALPTFKMAVAKVAEIFQSYAHEDLLTLLETAKEADLDRTELTQPLIFMIQVGLCALLKEQGVTADVVLGHSVGEVCAAYYAGLLSIEDAVKVVYYRSLYQGKTKGLGQMAAAKLEVEEALSLAQDVGFGEVEIAGINAPGSLTLSGSARGLAEIGSILRKRHSVFKLLPLDYAFHSKFMQPIEAELKEALAGLKTHTPNCLFLSSVAECASSGLVQAQDTPIPVTHCDAEYWWQNIRRPVHFARAVKAALLQGVRCFLEIGPHAILQQYLRQICKSLGITAYIGATMQRQVANGTLLPKVWQQLWVHGWPVDLKCHVPMPSQHVDLPHYAWQNMHHELAQTPEALGLLHGETLHPLLGTRRAIGVFEQDIDLLKYPWISDHRVGEACFYPAACFLEMYFAAAATKYGLEKPLELQNAAILRPVIFDATQSIKLQTTLESLDGEVRIYSRPLMQDSDWVMHTHGRVLQSAAKAPQNCELMADPLAFGHEIDVAGFYALTRRANMHYGPYFQPIERLWVNDAGSQAFAKFVEPREFEADMLIPPAILDGGLQLLFALIEPYVALVPAPRLPYWFDRCVLYQPGRPAYVFFELHSANVRNIVCTVTLYAKDGVPLLKLSSGRARTVARLGDTTKTKCYTTSYLPKSLGISGLDPELAANLESALQAKVATQDTTSLIDAEYLQEAYVQALVSEIHPRNLPAPLQTYVDNIRTHVDSLPESQAIWQTLWHDYPDLSHANLLLLALKLSLEAGQNISKVALQNYHEKLVSNALPFLEIILQNVKRLQAQDTTFKVVVQGFTQVTLPNLTPILAHEELLVTAKTHADTQLLASPKAWEPNTALFSSALWDVEKEPAPNGQHHVLVFCHALHSAKNLKTALTNIRESLLPNGFCVLMEEKPSLFGDLCHGFDASWWENSPNAANPTGQLLSSEKWRELLLQAGFSSVFAIGAGREFVLLAFAPGSTLARDAAKYLFVPTGYETQKLGRALKDVLTLDLGDSSVTKEDFAKVWEEALPQVIVALDPDLCDSKANILLNLAQSFAKSGLKKAHVWLLTFGACVLNCDQEADPYAAAAWGLARVIMNEQPNLQLTLIDLPKAWQGTVKNLAQEVQENTSECELILRDTRRYILRSHEVVKSVAKTEDANVCLEILDPGHLETLTFVPCARGVLSPGDVEVEMEAVGLNFRDVMWAMNLLPEEALEQGFSGPGLGIEGAGRISRVSSDTCDLEVGQPVLCFGPKCFQRYVRTTREACAILPQGLNFVQAATLPVTFFTAYYALHYLADLQVGERVLIHGACGGVGLAALQIAKTLGAEIYATAGTPLKRALLKELGIPHIFDSRSLSFKDEILEETCGVGVDCVLNSLAGEALRASLQLLRPFGRFLELGKSDFYADSPLRLKPFSKNVTYYGIDVDQLMLCRPSLGQRLLTELMQKFAEGIYKPLPATVFPATAIESAFRLMQKSQHVGKIVVTLA